MSPTYVLGLVFAGIILVTVFVKMRNSGLKESYGLWWYWIAFFTALLRLERRVEALEGRASSQGESGASQAASSSHDKAAPQGKKHKKKR